MVTKRFERWALADIHPYERNPRVNEAAVADVMESVRQCGELDPIEVDEAGVILSGHTRLKAYQRLGFEAADVVVCEGLSDAQKRKYRLLTNKTGEVAEWDRELLLEELEAVDFEGYDFGFEAEALELEEGAPDGAAGGKTCTCPKCGFVFQP